MSLEKPLRLSDIASEAGVSIVTAAKVLNHSGGKNTRVSEATAERIRQIAARCNYLPNLAARQLRLKKSGVIGVVMDSCAPQVCHNLLSQMEMYAGKKGYRFMIAQTHENIDKIKQFANDFVSYGVDGVICLAHQYPGVSQEIAESYANLTHTVFLEKPDGLEDSHSVAINVTKAFSDAVKYFYRQERRRIGLLLAEGPFANRSMSSRELGYQEGMQACGLEIDPALIQRVPIEHCMDEEITMAAVKKLLDAAGVEAIIAANDHLGAMVLKNLITLNVPVPGQIGVIGYDNIDIARLVSPSLTTFDQDRPRLAAAMIDLLLDMIDGKNIPKNRRNVIIDSIFIKRQSA